MPRLSAPAFKNFLQQADVLSEIKNLVKQLIGVPLVKYDLVITI